MRSQHRRDGFVGHRPQARLDAARIANGAANLQQPRGRDQGDDFKGKEGAVLVEFPELEEDRRNNNFPVIDSKYPVWVLPLH